MSGRRLTIEEQRKIIRKYKKGHSALSIANEFGVASTTIAGVVRRHRIPKNWHNRFNGHQRLLTPETARLIAQDYRAGSTADDIARDTGLSRVTVQRTLKRADIPVRKELRKKRLTPEQEIELTARANAEDSENFTQEFAEQLAKLFAVSTKTISRRLKKLK